MNQSHRNVEAIIVDSSKIPQPPRASNDQVRYIQQEPNGVTPALNTGIDEARGEFVCFLGADDFFAPSKLSKQVAFLGGGDYDIVYSDEYLVKDGAVHYDASLPVTDPDRHHVEFFRQWSGVGARTPLLRRECFDGNRFDISLDIFEDFHLWTRLFRQYRVGRLPEALSYKRVLPDSLSSQTDLAYSAGLDAIEDLLQRFPELREYETERFADYHFQFAMKYIRDERPEKAEEAVKKSVEYDSTDPRVYVAKGILNLPLSPREKRVAFERLHDLKTAIA